MSVHVCRGLKGGKRGSYVLVLGVIDTCSTTDLVERRLMRTNHCRPMAALLMAGVCTLAGRDSSGSVKTVPHTFRAALAVAEAVLYGEIIDKAVFQSPDGPQIWTRYTLAVERMLAGEVASSRFEFWVGQTCFGIWEPEQVGMPFVAQTGNPWPLRCDDVAITCAKSATDLAVVLGKRHVTAEGEERASTTSPNMPYPLAPT